MRILGRYLLLRFLGLFGATLLVLSLAVMMAEMLLNLDDLVEAPGGALGALAYLVLKLPGDYLFAILPISAFIASFAALGTLARSHELTAIKASGVSLIALCVPLLIAAAGLSVLSFAAVETLGVRAASAWQRQYRSEDEISYRRGSFWYHSGKLVYNVRKADPRTRTLHDVRVFELDERGRLLESIHAREARIEEDDRWRLEDVVTRRFDPTNPTAELDFERSPERTLQLERREDLALLGANPSSLALPDLRDYLRTQSFEGENVSRLRAHLHQRYADPLIAFVFALLAIPIGLRVEETRSLALPAVMGVGIVAAFWVLRGFGVTLAAEGAAPPTVMPWAVLALFGLYGAVALSRIPR